MNNENEQLAEGFFVYEDIGMLVRYAGGNHMELSNWVWAAAIPVCVRHSMNIKYVAVLKCKCDHPYWKHKPLNGRDMGFDIDPKPQSCTLCGCLDFVDWRD